MAKAGEKGLCRNCRYANHGTGDSREGFWACPWLGGLRYSSSCEIVYKKTGKYVFEPFDGKNCTWPGAEGQEGQEIVMEEKDGAGRKG